MAQAEVTSRDWTAADIVKRFGPMPLSRIRLDPPPGTATEEDVVRIHDHEDRLCELVEGVLVEKTVGAYESYLAALLVQIIGVYAREHDLGIVFGADGMMRLAPQLIRIPDVSFVSWERLGGHRVPRTPMANLAPDLAVEVISKSNTRKEMDRKLHDFFEAGVLLVWYIYPDRREARVFTRPDEEQKLLERDALEGQDVLPGFSLPLKELFAEPGGSKKKNKK